MKILLICCLLIVLFYFMPIQIKLKSIRKNNNDVILIRLKTLYGLLNLKTEIPYLKLIIKNGKPVVSYGTQFGSNKTNRIFKRLEKLLSINDLKAMRLRYLKNREVLDEINKYILSKTKVTQLILVFKIGFEDAALTSVVYGLTSSIVGIVLALFSQKINIQVEEIKIVPLFNNPQVHLEGSCIIHYKLGHIINAGIKMMYLTLSKKSLPKLHLKTNG